MKIKVLFTGLCLCSAVQVSYGQSQNQTLKESTPLVVSSHPKLNAQRAALDLKQAEINQAVSTSRAQVSKLNEEFRVLKEEYVRLIQTELDKTTDVQLKAQLQEEMSAYSGGSNSQIH